MTVGEGPSLRRAGAAENPPGRSVLRYRSGIFESFVEQMLDRCLVLSVERRSREGPDAASPLRFIHLNMAEPDHWLVALVKSWATVADVLSFYTERMIQEGYLRTAVEDLSVYELVRMIDYHPRPGVAGSAEVALTISEVKGLPEELRLPPGLVIRSVPPPGSEPQTFETIEPLDARAAWNVLRPTGSTQQELPKVSGDSTEIELEGVATGLSAGSAMLVTGERNGEPESFFRLAHQVEALQQDGPHTVVRWIEPLDDARSDDELAGVQVFALRQQAGLFGNNAPRWEDLPVEARYRVQGVGGGVLVANELGWEARNEGLPATAVFRCLAVDADGNLFAGTAGDGVFRSLDGGATWQAARRGLQELDIEALAVDSRGSLFAGTPGGGVYRSTDRGTIWEQANGALVASSFRRRWPWQRQAAAVERLPSTAVRALAVARWAGGPVLFAGTDAGVFRTGNAGRSWEPANRGLPGTDPGSGVTDLAVVALAVGPDDGVLYAGTGQGVFRSTDGGRRWRPANRGLPATNPLTGRSSTAVRTLVAYRDRRRGEEHLVAATSRGLFRAGAAAERWEPADQGLGGDPGGASPEVLCLLIQDDPVTVTVRLLAGTARGLFSSLDHGATWEPVPLDGPSRVEALAAGPQGSPLVAATPFGGLTDEWPRFHVRGGEIDLEGIVTGLVSGGWIVLVPGDGTDPSEAAAYRIQRVATVRRRDFSLAATVTRVMVEPDERLAGFDLRRTRAYVHSEPLPLRRKVRISVPASVGLLRTKVLAIGEPSRKLIVTGKTLRRVVQATGRGKKEMLGSLLRLRRAVDTVGGEVSVSVALQVAEQSPISIELTSSELREILRVLADEPGASEDFLRSLLAEKGSPEAGGAPADGPPEPSALAISQGMEKMYQALQTFGLFGGPSPSMAAPGAGKAPQLMITVKIPGEAAGTTTTVGELARALLQLETVRVDGGEERMTLRLPRPATGVPLVLDVEGLRVYGNVVAATEGATIAGEVLGDGDATRANQSFTLARPPAFLRTGGEPRADLEVRVQGQRWHVARVLHLHDGESRVYRLELDHLGRATVVFGSGNQGARLPTGRNNVVARYRSGMTSRSVPAGGLSLPGSRPLGLEGMVNPLPTTPGAEPEGREEIRRRAPCTVRTLDRVVSLRDYEDFAREFPGVARAGAWGLVVQGAPAVQVTLAAPGGEPIDEASDLFAQLRAAIDERRPAETPLFLQDYEPVRVVVKANLRIEADLLRGDVEKRVREVLESRFGFEESRFGGVLRAAAVVSALQRVPGVVAVDLDSFTWPGADEEPPSSIERLECRAREPYWDPVSRELRPAQIVMLGSPELELDKA